MLDVTRLLEMVDASTGPPDEHAIGALYDEIRRLARSFMRSERSHHTLPPTAVANEAWLRLFGTGSKGFSNGSEFLAAAANALRRVLVDHGRRRARQKRGGDRRRADIEVDTLAAPEPALEVVAVDAALERLATFDPTKARLVELRFFGGLTVAEAAGVLGMSERTAARDWRIASAFLRAEVQEHVDHDELDS